MRKICLLIFLFFFVFISCDKKANFMDRIKQDYIISSNKEEQPLIKAIVDGDSKKIRKIIQNNNEIIEESYNRSYFSYLHMAVSIENIKSVEILLKLGFNPNVKDLQGKTPLYCASGHSLYPYVEDDNLLKISEVLLQYGADPNQHIDEDETTPLINICDSMYFKERYLERAKLLIEKGGADVNLRDKNGATAADLALLGAIKGFGMNLVTRTESFNDSLLVAHYLINVNHTDIKESFFTKTNNGEYQMIYPVYLLRCLIYPLDSKEYKIKMEIFEEFRRQGVDYYSEPIPENIVEIIKHLYPDSSDEYLKVY